ncbi:hypothetical protein O5O45_08040 [Hahella aquimaris]|uniref:hypothetical protein n=1 Tax=Hahella sp. HNIBRBA332 TaxID=3015983 RepID=UPI00273B3D6E|nr:hypothetical protein [Hahella sp. HNIBRBA332]WLQ15862.1 hypothetical protein O5O45_08040 [Hahella sp. HNIBRBA332]
MSRAAAISPFSAAASASLDVSRRSRAKKAGPRAFKVPAPTSSRTFLLVDINEVISVDVALMKSSKNFFWSGLKKLKLLIGTPGLGTISIIPSTILYSKLSPINSAFFNRSARWNI